MKNEKRTSEQPKRSRMYYRLTALALAGVFTVGSTMPVMAATTTSKTNKSVSKVKLQDVFDAQYYADTYSDLKAAYGYDTAKLTKHYNTFGKKEGRNVSELINVENYKAAYPDLAKAFGNNADAYLRHYLEHGIAEGRYSFGTFDAVVYADRYPDLKEAFGYDALALYQHYIQYGRAEGRNAVGYFDATAYADRYPDLKAAFGYDIVALYQHYIQYGQAEGRYAGPTIVQEETTVTTTQNQNTSNNNNQQSNNNQSSNNNNNNNDTSNDQNTPSGGDTSNGDTTQQTATRGRLVNPETGEAITNAVVTFTRTSGYTEPVAQQAVAQQPVAAQQLVAQEPEVAALTVEEEESGIALLAFEAAENEAETPAVGGNETETETPDDGNGTETPDDGNGTETPDDENGTETPDDGNGTETPDDENGTETPDDENGTETPDDENGTETPDDGNDTETPDETPTPDDGNGTETPTPTPDGGNNTDVIVGDGYYQITTDGNGYYTIPDFEPGEYDVVAEAEGYMTLTLNSYTITSDSGEFTLPTFEMLSADMSGTNAVSGRAINATTGSGIAGATINVRANWNNKTGEILTTMVTDEEGNYTTDLERGYYTLEFVSEGFSSVYVNVASSNNVGTCQGVLSPTTTTDEVQSSEFRIVLTWGETPRDLDSHLVGPDGDSYYHVYYGHRMQQDENGNIIASLDVDDTSSYGPETITIPAAIGDKTYYYSVYNFSSGRDENSTAMSESGANVKVYQGSQLVKEYNVPVGRTGYMWNVFKIENGTVVDINDYNADYNSMYGHYDYENYYN